MTLRNTLCGLVWLVFAFAAFIVNADSVFVAAGVICNQIWFSKD